MTMLIIKIHNDIKNSINNHNNNDNNNIISTIEIHENNKINALFMSWPAQLVSGHACFMSKTQ